MDFKDISSEIASISHNYAIHKLPPWLLRLQEQIQQLLHKLREFLDSLFRHRAVGPGNNLTMSTLMQYGVYVAGGLAFLGICYYLWRRASVHQEVVAATKRGAASVDKILDSTGYRAQAEKLASAGEFKGACRALYLCLLQRMHEEKVAVFAPAKTNYEYRYILQAYPHLQTSFMQMADIVEQSWFGNKEAGGDDFTQCRDILSQAGTEVERIGAEKAKAAARAEAEL
jgi:hypothetical protein